MMLKRIKYSQFAGTKQEWYLEEFKANQINLIVGKNATGKSRTLSIIRSLANLISGDQKLIYMSGNYDASFESGTKAVRYLLAYENTKISNEELSVNNKIFLKRGRGGKGKIRFALLGRSMRFQSPENELACVSRRDSLQHPFFDDLYNWGKSSIIYYFGTQLGKENVAVFSKEKKNERINLKETDKVVGFFKRGLKKYGRTFVSIIKREMKAIGYELDDIFTSPIAGLISPGGDTIQAEGLFVKEADLKGITNQIELSQGMFRVLSLIIQINFSILEKIPSCVLIDDIGEGLDYERSVSLIKILIEKAKGSKIQLILSTNDRFVMNAVPLEYWHIIQRDGQKSKIFNYSNSRRVFDDFKFTGLNNFDFLSTEFYLKGFKKE